MRDIDANTGLCAVIGNPVEHSLSPAMHNAAFKAANVNSTYLAFRIEDVEPFLTGVRAMPSFRGVSVTIPHKMAVMPFLDEIEPMAQHIGSVNTITNEAGRLVGSSTDGPGTLRAFEEAGVSLDDRRVLFLGTGGAVRAVAFAAAELTEAEHITILGRTPKHVNDLVDDLDAKTAADIAGGSLQDDLAAALAGHDIIIQGTPVGMYPKEGETLIPPEMLRPEHVVFDMVYRPYKTRLIEDAEIRGCTTILGLEMLVNQAVLQFERWTGVDAPFEVMRNALVAGLTGH
jgi:shikimate dehydrogenase